MRRFEKAIFILIAILMGLDALTTYTAFKILALSYSGETNPMMRFIFITGDMRWFFLYNFMAVCTALSLAYFPYLMGLDNRLRFATGLFIIMIYVYVVVNNISQLILVMSP